MKNKSEVRRQKAEVRRARRCLRPRRFVGCLLLSFCLLRSDFCLPSASAQQAQGTPAANAAPATPHGPLTYDSFRLVHTRNVFDPDRRPIHPVGTASTTVTSRADYLALTGTLLDNNKTYAFFSGSRADFNKVLTVQDKIANATITEITPTNIVVERAGRRTNVAVGQTVPLDDKSTPGPAPSNLAEVTATGIDRPAPASGDAPPTSAPAGAPGTAPAAGATPPKGPTTSKEELMRKMMERRQQELK